jgi:hypothetical protein
MPESHIVKAFRSVEDAFAAGDHYYVTRFGTGFPELHGLSLIMLGNRVGGERILERFNVRSARSMLYRAYACWRDDHLDEARRWIRQARAKGGEDVALDRLEALMARDRFRVVVHSDYVPIQFLNRYLGIAGLDVIITRHLLPDDQNPLPIGAKLASRIPPGPPVDLVLVDDIKLMPQGVAELGAPVIVNPHDHEWYYDTLDQLMGQVDWISSHLTTDAVELGRAFGKFAQPYCNSLPLWSPQAKGLADRLRDTANRRTDILFTGGITTEYYLDKRQRVLPLSALPERHKVVIFEGILPMDRYEAMMRDTKFVMNSVRVSNGWYTRCIDSLSQGAFCLLERGNGPPSLFSDHFDCFQYYNDETLLEDVEALLARYPQIAAKVATQAPQIEAEICDIFPESDELRIRRYFKHMMFVNKVVLADRPVVAKPPQRPIFTSLPETLSRFPSQLARLEELNRPQAPGRAADWLRYAAIQAATPNAVLQPILNTISDGIGHHGKSVGLWYAYALCLAVAGHKAEAKAAFLRLAGNPDLVAEPDEPFPRFLDQKNSFYWVMDARIRARMADCLAPLVPEINVWRSYALAHAANLSLEMGMEKLAGRAMQEAVDALQAAAAEAQRALDLFPHAAYAQRAFLRAAFVLGELGDAGRKAVFLDSYRAVSRTDYTIFHDFAGPAVHLLKGQGEEAEAAELARRLDLFNKRCAINAYHLEPYAELASYFRNYGLVHARSRASA